MFELLLPFILIAPTFLPLANVFRGKESVSVVKRCIIMHVCFFFAIVSGTVFFSATKAYAAGADDVTMKMAGPVGQGLGFITVALAIGLSVLSAGIAVVVVAPTAIGTFSENEKSFGKPTIFVTLGEGVVIYGLLISIFAISMKL